MTTVAGNMDSGIEAHERMETIRLPALLRQCVLTLLLLIAVCGMSVVRAASSKVKFNLPADEFPKAILEFYHQSKVEVLFRTTDSIRKVRTQPVVGTFEPHEALEIMLRGTGLTYVVDSDRSVIIQPLTVSAPPPQEPAAAKTNEPPLRHHPFVAQNPAPRDSDVSEVLVTGTLIHTAMEVRAPLQVLSYSDFSQAPYPTVQDTLYQLPIMSLNAPREDLNLNNNYNYGTGVNLRGLGVAATLVLVNGRRQPLSGLNGDFVDLDNIPLAAVKRIEILPDGASALYGSDAVAGVVNIIMKDDFQGAETQVRYGGAVGGRDSVTVSQLLGTRWNSGKAMLVYEYADATALSASARGYAADADKTPYGGHDYRSYFTDPGNILSLQTLQPVYGIPAGLNGAPLTKAALSSTINLQNQFAQYQIFPQRTSHSIYGTASQEVGAGIELFAEGRFSRRTTYSQHFPETETLIVPSTNPFNPFGATTAVAYNFGQTFGPITYGGETRNYLGTFGARFKFGGGWQGTLAESYGRETLFDNLYNVVNPSRLNAALADPVAATAFNPFGGPTNSATIEAISHIFPWHAVSSIETTNFTADGPLLSLPAGDAKLAIGFERREESLDHTVLANANTVTMTNARYSRHVGSAFTELLVPIVGDASNLHAPPRLELNLAGRYDDYSDVGHTVNPEFSARWIPLEWLKLRASWGRSYRAPKLDDLYDTVNNVSGEGVVPDPKSPTGRSTVLVIQGNNPNLNNPNLKPETAKTWTAGFDLVPMFDPDLKLSLTYYSIDYEGQIAIPASANPFDILLQESEWAAVITRNPTAAQVAAVCNRPDYFQSRTQCLASSPAAIIYDRLANLALTKTHGLDLDLRQSLESGLGHFDFGFNSSYVFRFDQAVSDTSPSVNILNTFGNPLKLRFRAKVGWSRHGDEAAGLGADLAVNYTNGYQNPGSPQLPRIDALTTVDMQLRYRTSDDAGFMSGLELSLNAVNVFNQSPPFADNLYGYDFANFQGLGRVLSLSVRKKW